MIEASIAKEIIERRGLPGVSVTPLQKNAGLGGGGFEGAERLGRELASWRPTITTADGALGRGDKILLDGRARDLLRNHGPMMGTMAFHKDSIVGAQYRLNARPVWKYLGLSESWAEEYQEEVESLFNLYAENEDCWLDVDRNKTLTDIVRLAIGCFFTGGEVVGTVNWMSGVNRPFRTAFQMVDADRVSNPYDAEDTLFLRRGVKLDGNGAQVGVHIRRAHPFDRTPLAPVYEWDYWPVRKSWGRLNLLHILDQMRPEQHRGVAEMVAALKETRMGKRFHEVALANAIVQASYAAAIESEMPRDAAFESIGAGETPIPPAANSVNTAMSMMEMIAAYSRGANNLQIDGVKIPYLPPGSKLNLMHAGVPGGMGGDIEQSYNRYISRTLGVSYEEYTNDYSQTNYSSAKASGNNTLKYMMSRKRKVADRTANAVYTSWLEEAVTEGHLRSVRDLVRRDSEWFYRGMNKAALANCTWIGATRGQVDEVAETQAAIMRIQSGLSTVEIESSKLGNDFRDVYSQLVREQNMREKMGLVVSMGTNKPTVNKNDTNGQRATNQEDLNNGGA